MPDSSSVPAFTVPGEPDHFAVKATPLPASGLSLSRSAQLGEFFDVSGNRTVVIGREGAGVEVWCYPFQALSRVDFQIRPAGDTTPTPLEKHRQRFTVRPESSSCEHAGPGWSAVQTVFCPPGRASAVWVFDIVADEPAVLIARLQSALTLMWPAGTLDQGVGYGQDEGTGAWVIRARNSNDAVVCGWIGGHSGEVENEKELPVLEHLVDTPGYPGVVRRLFALGASTDGVDAARKEFTEAAAQFSGLYGSACSLYASKLSEWPSLEIADPIACEAFQWAAVGLDKCYMETPGLGKGLIAGFNESSGSARPGFGWYFGRDSAWTGFAVNCLGDFSRVSHNLRLLAKYQIPDGPNVGKIYHELSAAHERIPGADYAFPAGDSTPFFVVALADYYDWTADEGLVREMWPHVEKAMDWCLRMDVDADGLIDNPPAGHQWYDYGEKNMVDLVAIWARALECAASLAVVVGADGRDWAARHEAIIGILNSDFWNEKDGYLFDRKLPDGQMTTLTTCNPSVPLLWGQVEPEKAARAVERMSAPDLTVEWGFRTNSSKDQLFTPSGYHEGTVWPLTTGWASLASFAAGRPDLGWQYLKCNADLTRDWCLGYIPEVVDGGQRVAGGCPHQAWSEAMIVLPVVHGLFGVRADWPSRTVRVAPALPPAHDRASLKGLRVGESRIDINVERTESQLEVRLVVHETPIRVRFAPFVVDKAQVVGFTLLGETLPVEMCRWESAGSGHRLVVEAPPRLGECVLRIGLRT